MRCSGKKSAAVLLGILLAICMVFPSFAGTYVPSGQLSISGEFMLVCKTKYYGNYVVGMDDTQAITRAVPDLEVVENDDPRFLFTMEPDSGGEKFALRCSGNGKYLAFPYTENFLNEKPVLSDMPVYRWNVLSSRSGAFILKYAEKGKAGGLWVNDDTVTLKTAAAAYANDIAFYIPGESAHAVSGGWKLNGTEWKYLNSDGSYKVGEWFQENGSWYYFKPDGNMAVGLTDVGGVNYYFFADGRMMADTEMSVGNVPYVINQDGAASEIPASSPERAQGAENPADAYMLNTDQVINWINVRRWTEGLSPMHRDGRLCQVAKSIYDGTGGQSAVSGPVVMGMTASMGMNPVHAANLAMNLHEEGYLSLDWYYENWDAEGFRNPVLNPGYNHVGVYGVKNPISGAYSYILVFAEY
ncbi:MAG: hypothetical protein Q4F29_08890 [Lachnospiraceae bacterium]|nr:hypothetical protein [Lachnospiraceae bacterium]